MSNNTPDVSEEFKQFIGLAIFNRAAKLGLVDKNLLEQLEIKWLFHGLNEGQRFANETIKQIAALKHRSFHRVRNIVYAPNPFDDLLEEGK